MIYRVSIREDYDAYLDACEAEQRRHDLKRREYDEDEEEEE